MSGAIAILSGNARKNILCNCCPGNIGVFVVRETLGNGTSQFNIVR